MPVPTYTTPLSPLDTEVLGATHENLWVRAIEYLHGKATAGYHPFTGCTGRTGSGWAYSAEVEIWRGYYVYRGGPKKIYNKIYCTERNMIIYASHDGGEATVQTITSDATAATTPIDMTAYTLTSGTKYYVRVVVQNTSAPSRGAGRVDWAYIPGPNASSLAWATPTTFTDGNLSGQADLSNLTSNCNYLKTIIDQERAGFKACTRIAPLGSSQLVSWNGSFVYKGLNTLETHISHTVSDSVASLHIVDDAGTNDRTVASITTTDNAFLTSYDISALSPALAVGSRYRLYVTENVPSGPQRGGISVKRIYFSGSKALTTVPQRWTPGDYGYGSTGANRMAYISSALTDIRAVAEYDTITGVDYGRQYLVANNIDVPDDDVTATTATFLDFKFSRAHRFLFYLPTATGASGTLTYGTSSASLPDNNADGTWTALDLETVSLLPIGYTYKVTGVKDCFECATGS